MSYQLHTLDTRGYSSHQALSSHSAVFRPVLPTGKINLCIVLISYFLIDRLLIIDSMYIKSCFDTHFVHFSNSLDCSISLKLHPLMICCLQHVFSYIVAFLHLNLVDISELTV